jgi:hypothetical protein
MTDVREFPPGGHPVGPWQPGPPVPPGAPFPHIPAPRHGGMPPAGLPYGYPGPPTHGWGPGPVAQHPYTAPMPPVAAGPDGTRRRTALVAVALCVLILGGILAAVVIMSSAVSAVPPAPAPAPAPAPTSHYTLTSMFAGNGTCTPTTASEQIPSTTEGLVCPGQGDGAVFIFYRYTGASDTFENSLVRGWGGSGLQLRSEDACSVKYTGTIDIPDVGPTPVVVDVYRNSPFVAVTGAMNGQSVESVVTPRYQVANRADLCAGG